MTAPTFKVLLHSIALGQPPEPVGGVRALVEQMLVQQQEIDELKRQLALLQNRVAALTRGAEPEQSQPVSSGHPISAPGSQPPSAAHVTTGSHQIAPPPSEGPPSGPQAPPAPRITHTYEEDEERHGTMVMSRKQVLSAKKGALPFAPTAAGQTARDNREIPGAPWATQPATPVREAVSEDTFASEGSGSEPPDPLNMTAEVRVDQLDFVEEEVGEGPPPIPDIEDDESPASGRPTRTR